MAKTNIVFNNTNYSIDDSSLSSATAELRSHLSTVMNGSGATINFGGTAYNVDSAKLTTATNSFISHLGTIAGEGTTVTVGGTEYSIDSTKLTDAISELESVFGGVGEERLEGDGAEYYTLAPTALSFRSTAPLNELQEVQVNGVTVDPSNYTLEEGSTIVTFPIEYLKTLDVGSYEVNVASDSKSVKGGFTVAAPELNEHGFYYNQPYTANVPYLGGQTVFFLRESGQMDVTILDNGYIETCSYVADGNNLTINATAGTFTGTANANNIYCNELATTFVLGDESIAADEDYIYTYKEDLGGYEVTPIDKAKASYGAIKTGINGIDTVKLVEKMFENNTNLTTIPEIPSTITCIGEYLFCGCVNLTNVIIPKHITSLDILSFSNCTSLKSVTFESGSQLTRIEQGVFLECSSLETITIPDGVTFICSDAFRDCISLKSVNIPETINSIGVSAFSNCSSLTYNEYDNAYYLGNDDNPYIALIKSTSKHISSEDISNCTINANAKVIASGAFSTHTRLREISFEEGSQIMYINNGAFNYCRSLNVIEYSGTMAQWNAIVKESDWKIEVPATYVQCSDGQVSLV